MRTEITNNKIEVLDSFTISSMIESNNESMLKTQISAKSSTRLRKFGTNVLMLSVPLFASTTNPDIAYSRLHERQIAGTSAAVGSFRVFPGKRISLAEARRRALQILKEAEERRLQFAEEEAKQSMIWEEMS